MSKLVYLKVLVLVAAFIAVVYVMLHMTPDKVAQGMGNMGLAPAPAASGGAAASAGTKAVAVNAGGSAGVSNEQINLCPTRVHTIAWPDGRKIQEQSGEMKAKWQAYNLDPVDIGSMDMEKWLSLHCMVSGSARSGDSGSSAAGDLKPYVTFSYIDGSHEDLQRSADGSIYGFKGQKFASPDLTQAMTDLINLANLHPTGP